MTHLPKRQRALLEAIPHEWQNMNTSPNMPLLVKLEKRGLVELRLDPSISQVEAEVKTRLGQYGHWQVRRKLPSYHCEPPMKPIA